jgi:hypothetical protein
MIKISLILCLFLGSVITAKTQPNWSWSVSNGGLHNDLSYDIATDISGNIYTTGYFRQTVDFDPGVGVDNHTSLDYWDAFIQKLDKDGNYIWAKTFGASNSSESVGYSITTDSNGNVYVAGNFDGTVDFDPGNGITNITSSGNNDIFILKVDSNGTFIWAKAIGGASHDGVKDILVDISGNIYVTGFYSDTVDFDPNSGVTHLSSSGGADIFVQKLDEFGNLLWAKSIGGTEGDYSHSIAIDSFGSLCLVGIFKDTVDFDPNAGMMNLSSSGGYDSFILRLDSSGDFIWAKSIGGSLDEVAYSVGTDMSNNLYISGDFKGTVDFDPNSGSFNLTANGGYDYFIQKLDQNGDLSWAKAVGGSGADGCYAADVDSSGNIYLTGKFNDMVDFDPNAGVTNMTSSGFDDIFIEKIDANGDFIWVKTMGGSNSLDVGRGITSDLFGNIYLTGSFNGTTDLDPGPDNSNHTTSGLYDFFTTKLAILPNGFEAISDHLPITLYPNPVSTSLYIANDNLKISKIYLYDIVGNLVQTMEFETNAIDFSSLPSGVYFVEIITNKGKITHKVLKS